MIDFDDQRPNTFKSSVTISDHGCAPTAVIGIHAEADHSGGPGIVFDAEGALASGAAGHVEAVGGGGCCWRGGCAVVGGAGGWSSDLDGAHIGEKGMCM